MRLIDADALKEELNNWAVDLTKSKFPHYIKDDADCIIDNAPTIDAVPRWIPCEERLPREKEVVLITNSKGNVRCGQFRGTSASGRRWVWKGNIFEMVEAWMPLPEPYGGERKDDEL